MGFNSVYITCPVRDAAEDEAKAVRRYMGRLESGGVRIHNPPDHTDQIDDIGLYICHQNRGGISASDENHMWYNPKSQGSTFDTGMVFMAGKPLYMINDTQFSGMIERKLDCGQRLSDYEHFLRNYAYNLDNDPDELAYELERKEEIERKDYIIYKWQGYEPEFLFDFGMSFMAGKPMILSNRDEVKKTARQIGRKDFTRVLLALDSISRDYIM
jgi:hypothetical protein